MELVSVLILSVVSFAVLLGLTRLTGNRQISQMSMFDYVSSISTGSIAAELATRLDGDWWQPLAALCVYGGLTALLAFGCRKSLRVRKAVSGVPVLLYRGGSLYRHALSRAHITVDDLLTQMRGQGYFDLGELQAVVQETSGQLSFLPRTEQRPVKVEDLDLAPEKEDLVVNLVLDGHILGRNLAGIGRDSAWLGRQLAAHGFDGPEGLLLVTWDRTGKITLYPDVPEPPEAGLYL